MHQLLALHLCRLKRDPDSWWKPYVDLLPSHFNTMPVKYPKALAVHLPDSLIGWRMSSKEPGRIRLTFEPFFLEEVAQQSKKIKQDYMAALQFLKVILAIYRKERTPFLILSTEENWTRRVADI